MDDFEIFRISQMFLRRLMRAPSPEVDELIFVDFRPYWLKRQRSVYRALASDVCSICMVETFTEHQPQQHNPKHPPICRNCFERISVCPFCRQILKVRLDRFGLIEARRILEYNELR